MSENKTEKFLVKFQSDTFDLTNFIHKHPGGLNTLAGLNNSEIDTRFKNAPPHSDAAMYLMKEYRIEENNNESNYISKDTISNGVNGHANGNNVNFRNGIEHTIKNGNCVNDKENKFEQNTDDSMEHLVDWSKPMVRQISTIGPQYAEWVNKPVDRYLRLFGPDYLEMLTRTPWWLVPLFWVPTTTYILYSGHLEATNMSVGILSQLCSIIFGVVLWTLIEYTLHRYVFHLDPTNVSNAVKTFHFLIHGLHHKVPFDPDRLVFPPVPAVFIATILYAAFYMFVSQPRLVLAGGLMGYLVYDMIHYYLHYGSPSSGHLYKMKRYHYQHHFVHHDLGFGISSDVWDVVFNTQIFLRKLKYVLKW